MDQTPACCGRREVIAGSGALVAAVALSGCSSAAERAAGAATDNAAASSAQADTAAAPVATTSEVPVGGGVVVAARQVVLTQPTEGEFRAFSSICTHQGCPVTSVQDGAIVCPCHGSHFDIDSGEAISGPARNPLSSMTVSVEGQDISVS